MISRRKFFSLAAGLIAAPTIIKMSALMPLRGEPLFPVMREVDVFSFATQGMGEEGYEAHFADMARGHGMIAYRSPGRPSPWIEYLEAVQPYHPWLQGGGITQAPEMVYR